MCVSTMQSLDGLLRAKQLELDRVTEASRSLQWLKQEAEKRHGRSLAENEALIGQLQASLEKRNGEAEVREAWSVHLDQRGEDGEQ